MKKSFYITLIICFLSFSVVMHRETTSAHTNQKKSELEKIIDIREEYKLTGKDISIAILDTGVDLNNEELNIKGGATFVEETSNYQDLNGHGTYITGVIGLEDKGIAPGTDIYSVKVLDRDKNGDYESIIKGIKWAMKQEVDIILMSLGGHNYSKKLEDAIKKAHEQGITIISAVGNNGISHQDTVTYPAKFPEVISVGAVKNNNERWFKSSRGYGIDIMAPGEDIPGVILNNEKTSESGTSIAAAYVAGLICLMKEKENMTNEEMEKALKETAIHSNNEYEFGSGTVNIGKFLKLEKDNSFFEKLLNKLISLVN